jgi:hypothetical protein
MDKKSDRESDKKPCVSRFDYLYLFGGSITLAFWMCVSNVQIIICLNGMSYKCAVKYAACYETKVLRFGCAFSMCVLSITQL